MKVWTLILALSVIVWGRVGYAQTLDALGQTITPIIAGGSEKIENPQEIRLSQEGGRETIVASTAQDGANYAILEAFSSNEGCVKFDFPSGEGFVATGISGYRLTNNMDTTLLSKREACVVAYMRAKEMLAQTLGEPEVQRTLNLKYYTESELNDNETLQNSSEEVKTAIERVVKELIRGHVLFKIVDDEDNEEIIVYIVATPKTIAACERTSPVCMDAEDIRKGVEQIKKEISEGVVPLVGGKMITVPGTELVAFVSFGSAVPLCPANASKSVLSANRRAAIKIATMDAQASMLELLYGDNLTSFSKFSSVSNDKRDNFVKLLENDVLEDNVLQNIERLEEQQEIHRNVQALNETSMSAQRGTLPSGVETATIMDRFGFACAICVYIPSKVKRPIGRRGAISGLLPEDSRNPEIPTGTISNLNDL